MQSDELTQFFARAPSSTAQARTVQGVGGVMFASKEMLMTDSEVLEMRILHAARKLDELRLQRQRAAAVVVSLSCYLGRW
jgi:hypothetical protein